jgi:hypothetical protein
LRNVSDVAFAHRPVAGILIVAAFAAAGCGSSSSGGGVNAPKIGAARVFSLANFQPSAAIRPGVPTKVSFTIKQPNGKPLTQYKTGAGPHTGVHLILVRKDLSQIVHQHPPISSDGQITQNVTFPSPGPWRVLVDAYPNLGPQQPNFQLTKDVNVSGHYTPKPLPAFKQTVVSHGYRFTITHVPKIKAIKPAFLNVTVTDPHGKKVAFKPWFGALAHAIFFRQGSIDYFHTHVCGAGAPNCTSLVGGAKVSGQSTTPGKLNVGVLLPLGGTWRLFLQTKPAGTVLTAPFTLKVGG